MLRVTAADGEGELHLEVLADRPILQLTIDGQPVAVEGPKASLHGPRNTHRHSEWQPARGPLVIARFADGQAAFVEVAQP